MARYLKLFSILESATASGHYAHSAIGFTISIVGAVQSLCLNEVNAVVNALCLKLNKMNLACTKQHTYDANNTHLWHSWGDSQATQLPGLQV